MKINKIIILITLISIILFINDNAKAIGNFSLGVNTGGTYDPNNLKDDINYINKEIEYQKDAGAGTGEQIDIPYGLVAGANLKYQFNYILFRIGAQFVKPGEGTKGSFTSGGVKNEIRISTYQASFPITIGFMLPIKEKTNFYIGCGITYHIAAVKITQSNPYAGPFAAIPDNHMKDSYYGQFPGWHFILGAEVPFFERYSITVEWMHQEGRSHPLSNRGVDGTGAEANSPKRIIKTRGDFILFGINYYISF